MADSDPRYGMQFAPAELLRARRYEEERHAAIAEAKAQHAAAKAKPDEDLAAAKAAAEETKAALASARAALADGSQASIDAYHAAQNDHRTALHTVAALLRLRKPTDPTIGVF